MFSKKYFDVALLMLLSIALLPYLVICFYAFPFADDFCFGWTASENISLVQKFLNQYLYWNGRYTADVLVNLHPLVSGKIVWYQLAIFVSLLITPVVLYFFAKQFIKDNGTAIVVVLFVTLFYFNYQPNITEGMYWFIGISNYHLGILSFIIQLTFLIKSFSAEGKGKIIFQTLSCLFLVISIGFNEIGAMLIPVFYFCMAVFNGKRQTANGKLWVAYCAVAVLASAFVFFSPGNFVRTHEFENRYDLFHSLLYSALQTARFIGTWVLSVPFILLSVVVISYADKIEKQWTKQIDYRIVFAFLLFTVFAGSFLPYFATGVLGQHRTINYVFFFFILLWILFLISVSEKFLLHQKLIAFKNEGVVVVLLVGSIFFMMHTGNGYRIIADYRSNSFKKYATEFYQRQEMILQNPDATIEKLSVIPATFTIVDVRSDSTWWVDKCMKKYYIETKFELK